MHVKSWKRKESTAQADVDAMSVWPPAIEHDNVYRIEPELLKPAPRQIVLRAEPDPNEPRNLLIFRLGVVAFWIVFVYLMLLPKSPAITTFSDLITLPDWKDLPHVIRVTVIVPILLLLGTVIGDKPERRAVSLGTPLISYVYQKKRGQGYSKTAIVHRFQIVDGGPWWYADMSVSEEQWQRIRIGTPFTVLTCPGVHPYIYVCIYDQSSYVAI